MGHVRPDPKKYRPGKPAPPIVHPTAREISKADFFIELCGKLDVTPTVRQARKYKQRYGKFAKKT